MPLALGVGEQVAGLAVEGFAESRQRVGVNAAGFVGLHQVVAGGHGEARQLGEPVGGDALLGEQLGERPANRHGPRIARNVRLDNSTAWPYYSSVPQQGLAMHVTIEYANGVGHIDQTATGYRASFYGRRVVQVEANSLQDARWALRRLASNSLVA